MAKRYFGKNFKQNPLEIVWNENVEYIKLEEDKTFRVDGIGFSRGNYGVQPLVVRNTDSECTEIVTLPTYMYDEVQELLEDEEFVSCVKSGSVSLETYGYDKELKSGKHTTIKRCIGYNFVCEEQVV